MSVVTIGADTSTSLPTSLTNSGVSNTKGAWTQLSASTSADAVALLLIGLPGGANELDILLDIGTGGAGAETAIVSNLQVQDTNGRGSFVCYVPVAIASGTRVSARYQASAGTGTMALTIYLLNETANVPLKNCTSTTYGANTADSGSTSVDPGGSANTKGSYSQITASTSDDIDWLIVNIGAQGNVAPSTASWLIDIATGGAGSETVVVPNMSLRVNSGSFVLSPQSFGPFPVTIASGTRLAARAQANITDATDRLIDVQVVGFNGTAISGGGGATFHAGFMG